MKTAIPAWLRARPPDEALGWAASALGEQATVERLRRLPGGGWLAVHALDIRDAEGTLHRLVLRRWARPGWEQDPGFTPDREAHALRRLERLAPSIAAPRVVAVAVDGEAGDVPAILLTRLPGRPWPCDVTPPPAAIERLAQVLVDIHAVDASMREAAPPFELFYDLERLRVPRGSRRPELWKRALDVVRTKPPGRLTTFLHRDYHPGNTLWIGSKLTGVVDWTAASWGPPAADLGHLVANLGVDHGPDVARRVIGAYRAAGGVDEYGPWWNIRMLLDWGPDQEQPAMRQAIERTERYLAWLLERI